MEITSLKIVNVSGDEFPWRNTVAVATTTNITVTNITGTTIDGYVVQSTDRVLVKNQTTTSQNGIYQNNLPLVDESSSYGVYYVINGTTQAGKIFSGTTTFVSTLISSQVINDALASSVTSYSSTKTNSIISALQLESLSDVLVTSPASGQFLEYNGTKWINSVPPTAPVTSVFTRTGAVTAQSGDYSISQITNATVLANTANTVISSPASGQVVSYNGTNWVNAAPQNIYNTDGTLTGDRTITINGHTLVFGTGPAMLIDDTNITVEENMHFTKTLMDGTASVGTSGQILSSTSTGVVWVNPATVTSVALSLPGIFTVSGSPVTSSGTLTATLTSESANTVFAGPNGSAGTPSFRALVNADFPASGVSSGSYTLSNLTVNSQGIITSISNGTAPVTSVFTRTGAVSAQSGDYSISQITNATVLANTASTVISSPSSGQVVTYNGTNWANAAAQNIYNTNGTLTGDRTVTINGHTLIFGTTPAMLIDDTNITVEENMHFTNTIMDGSASVGTSGQVLSSTGTKIQWITPGSGSVTSVALSLPGIFTVSGSPVTSSGTLTATLTSESANTVFAGPNGSTGTPSFRALVNADFPASGASSGSYTLSNLTVNSQGIITSISNGTAPVTSVFTRTGAVTAQSGDYSISQITNATVLANTASTVISSPSSGQVVSYNGTNWVNSTLSYVTSVALAAPSEFTVSGSPVTGSGTLTFSKASQTQNLVYASPNGSTGTPSFRALVNADFPASGVSSGSYTLSNLTVNSQGIITSISNGTAPVTSVFTRTGAVTAQSGDYSLSQIGTVSLSSPSSGQVLEYNGTNWVNTALPTLNNGKIFPSSFSTTNFNSTAYGSIQYIQTSDITTFSWSLTGEVVAGTATTATITFQMSAPPGPSSNFTLSYQLQGTVTVGYGGSGWTFLGASIAPVLGTTQITISITYTCASASSSFIIGTAFTIGF